MPSQNAPDTSRPPGAAAPEASERHAALAALRESARGTLLEAMGMDLVSISAEGGVMTMPVAGNTQPAGLLHGGATIALAESIASIAAIVRSLEVHGEGAQAVGTGVSAIHHRSAREGTVTATATSLHLGRQVASYLVEVRDPDDRLLSTVTVSTMLLPPRAG